MSKWKQHIEPGIYLFFGGLLILLVNRLMLSPITLSFYEGQSLREQYPADSLGIFSTYYITLIAGVGLVLFGAAELIRGIK